MLPMESAGNCPSQRTHSYQRQDTHTNRQPGEQVKEEPPYEAPRDPEIRLNTVGRTPEESAMEIVEYLTERGFLRPEEI